MKQQVNFRNVIDFLDFLPESELEIVLYLIEIIKECLPFAKEKLSYNVPFYKMNKNICFIWPASILWGNKQTYTGVRLGFSQAYLMNESHNYLEKGTRKQVYWKDFNSIKEIDTNIVKSLLFEALQIDVDLRK